MLHLIAEGIRNNELNLLPRLKPIKKLRQGTLIPPRISRVDGINRKQQSRNNSKSVSYQERNDIKSDYRSESGWNCEAKFTKNALASTDLKIRMGQKSEPSKYLLELKDSQQKSVNTKRIWYNFFLILGKKFQFGPWSWDDVKLTMLIVFYGVRVKHLRVPPFDAVLGGGGGGEWFKIFDFNMT